MKMIRDFIFWLSWNKPEKHPRDADDHLLICRSKYNSDISFYKVGYHDQSGWIDENGIRLDVIAWKKLPSLIPTK